MYQQGLHAVVQVARLAEQSRRLQGQLHDFLPSHLDDARVPGSDMHQSAADHNASSEEEQNGTHKLSGAGR